MAKDEITELQFTGPHEDLRAVPLESRPTPPSNEFARTAALAVLDGERGKYRTTPHCKQRMTERDFDVFDVLYVIRNGACVGVGEYCEEFGNFKYKFSGDIDGVRLDAVFGLSATHDLLNGPVLVLITGCWKTASGCKSVTY